MENNGLETGLNDILYDTFDTLRAYGFVRSGSEFSRDFLGRSDRLYSWILSSGHEPNLSVMLGLYNRLEDMYLKAESAKEHINAIVLSDLTDRLWEEIRAESLRKGPNRRKKPAASMGDGFGNASPRAPAVPQDVEQSRV